VKTLAPYIGSGFYFHKQTCNYVVQLSIGFQKSKQN